LKEDALAAVLDGEDGVRRGKANLIAAYQQMRKSPDVTTKEAGRLFDEWLLEFQNEKKRLESTTKMSRSEPIISKHDVSDDLAEAMRRIEL
jgi:hypothetical protein